MRFQHAQGPARLCAVCVELDDKTGKAKGITPIQQHCAHPSVYIAGKGNLLRSRLAVQINDNMPHTLYQSDLVIVNGENAAERNGITEQQFRALRFAGADVVTLGNHAWANQDIYNFIDGEETLVRPYNYPEGTPGRGYSIVDQGAVPSPNLPRLSRLLQIKYSIL